MKTPRRFGFMLIFVTLGAVSHFFGQATSTPAERLEKVQKPVSALVWLVGGVWTADASGMGQGKLRVQTRYQLSDNGSFIRFTTHFVTDQRELKNYDGNLFWDPARKSLYMWYTSAANVIIEGPMTIDGDHWQMSFNGEDFEGKQAALRVDVLRKSNDLYRWGLSEKQGDAWKEIATLDYVRTPAP
jgi:hypothetical protein